MMENQLKRRQARRATAKKIKDPVAHGKALDIVCKIVRTYQEEV